MFQLLFGWEKIKIDSLYNKILDNLVTNTCQNTTNYELPLMQHCVNKLSNQKYLLQLGYDIH